MDACANLLTEKTENHLIQLIKEVEANGTDVARSMVINITAVCKTIDVLRVEQKEKGLHGPTCLF